MTKKERTRLECLVTKCAVALQETRQSVMLWRGEMRVVVAAFREIERKERVALAVKKPA